MKTRVSTFTNLFLSLTFCLGLASCNKEDFYQKEFLENPFQDPTTAGSVNSGGQGGSDSGVDGGTQGGVDSGVNGGTSGSTTGSSTVGGTDGGATVGGTDGGATVGGTTGGISDCNNGHGNDSDGVDESNPVIGTESKCKKEKFSQTKEGSKKLDIVWIIDNSGSMSDEQEDLGINFSAFIDNFITKDVDFKMAITTTDTSSNSKNGLMVKGSDTKLTSAKAQASESQFKKDFKSLVKVGTGGSGIERGLAASEGFMNKYAASFIRPDAYLAVVILSDEEDQSSETVQYYTDKLKGHKSEEGLIKIYSIVDVNKTNRGGGIKTGYERYAQASNNTAGIVADIRDDFHRSLSDMGNSIINLLDSFALSNAPMDGTLKVYVNGVESMNYTYDSGSRSIKFDSAHVPPVGAEITVTYVKL